MLPYELAEMTNGDGTILRYEVRINTCNYAIHISEIIKSTSAYRELAKKLPSPRLLLYFQYIIRKEIYPFVRDGYVIQWYKHNNILVPPKDGSVTIPNAPPFHKLKRYWDFENVPIRFEKQTGQLIADGVMLLKSLKRLIKRIFEVLTKMFAGPYKIYSLEASGKEKGISACHYAEGLNPSKRNDLNWFPGSGMDPSRVLIYFDSFKDENGKQIGKDLIQLIESKGFKWVALRKGIKYFKTNYWEAPRLPKGWTLKKGLTKNITEKWVVKTANDLLAKVHYWRSFYDAFNIKINYIPEEMKEESIIQAIAFDIAKDKPGALVGKQRSEIFLPSISYLGYHPKHVFFTWNQRAADYLDPNYDQIETHIVTGYPNDVRIKKASDLNLFTTLRSKGAKFIIALFDNKHTPDSHCSRGKLTEFYQTILRWVLDDRSVGLVIKSKGPDVIDTLHLIRPLLYNAMETGRCVRMENERGRFPSDASFGADMAIGYGISSALIEAVMGGCRGICCDMTCLKSHEFYKWGHKKIIFENLAEMMTALKRCKEDPNSEPGLGDWTSHMDSVDPFRDGQGGQRMGTYMCWMLEGFEKGFSRKEAIDHANKLYAAEWGEDKVIDMRQNDETA